MNELLTGLFIATCSIVGGFFAVYLIVMFRFWRIVRQVEKEISKNALGGEYRMTKSSDNLDAILKEVAKRYGLSSEKWDDDYELRKAEVRQLFGLLAAKHAPIAVKIKRLHPDAVIPKYAHEGDAGFDLVAVEDTIIEPGETKLVRTGLAVELPPGYEIQIRPRSGISLKTKLRVVLGTVDAGYRGEIGVIVDNIRSLPLDEDNEVYLTSELETIDGDYVKRGIYADGTYIIRRGDRIAQSIIKPVEQAQFVEVDELSESQRGEYGFGSSGVKSE